MKINRWLSCFGVLLVGVQLALPEPGPFNYAEALQKSLYFYEAQQSGKLSPNNRVPWRGDACLTDGSDIGRDLSGGWFDAGDHWTANLTMAFAGSVLAWSALEEPQGYLKSGQMDELLEGLVHVNRYFLKCILNPDCANPATDLEVVIGCGGREGVESPNVHSMWGPAEVAHLMTQRPTFKLNKDVPGADIPAAMAASMAACAQLLREHGAVLARKKGFETFQAERFADELLAGAEKLVLFARAQCGPPITDKMPKEEQELWRKKRNRALRSDGQIVETGYRSEPSDKIFAAATFLHRAWSARNPGYGGKWLTLAREVMDNYYRAEGRDDWWRDFSAGNIGKLGTMNMLRFDPADVKCHQELQYYSARFCEYKSSPAGLKFREWLAHEYGSLRHANNAAVIALYYSRWVEKSPTLPGNTWWKGGKSNEQLREWFEKNARRQVNYALGDNPYGRSYLVGFGNQSFNHVHHRGAYGAWAGFEHFIKGKSDDRGVNRHVLYGALVAGPDHNDVFLCGKENRPWKPLPDGSGSGTFYKFPNREELVVKEGYVWNAADQPVQEVMDSVFNEVALDYNAGFTASLALLVAQGLSAGGPLPDDQFPPPDPRNNNTDLRTTDREFFVSGRRLETTSTGSEIQVTLWNRSRWPAQATTNLAFRYYFTLDGATQPGQVRAEVSGAEGATVRVIPVDGRKAYAEVSFPGISIYPGSLKTCHRNLRLKFTAPQWDLDNDWSADQLATEEKLLPKLPVYNGAQLLAGEPAR